MKQHFHEQLIETTRAYETWPRNSTKPDYNDIEDAPLHASMRRNAYGWGKTQRDNLNPLRKFIEANVGRPWDKVYSEICAKNDPRNISQYHLRSHVYHLIEKDVVMINNIPHHGQGRWGYLSPIYHFQHNGGLYIHPVTGLVCQVKHKRPSYRTRKPKEVTHIDLDAGESYQKRDGVWYRIRQQLTSYRLGGLVCEKMVELRSVVGAKELKKAGLV